MSVIKNRYEFMFYLACKDANPNGDPDMDNLPRADPDTNLGYITDVAIKRRIRDYVAMAHGSEPGMALMMEAGTNKNRKIAEAKAAAGIKLDDVSSEAIDASRLKACELFYDVRAFGAVLSTGPNAGQVLGPVQIVFARSLDPVEPIDIGITSCSRANEVKGAKTVQDYVEDEKKTNPDKMQGMGRKTFIPFGLYEVHGFVSANLAAQTGFREEDLNYLFEAVANMYDATRSASKGTMSVVSPVIIFKHSGRANVSPEEQERSAKLGRAPAHKLFELVRCRKIDADKTPADYRDYACEVNVSGRPDGIDIGFFASYGSGITWNQLPAGEDWVVMK